MVSGAGTTAANGLYEIQTGTISGASYWANAAGYKIYLAAFSGGAWLIELNDNGAVYETVQTDLTSPLSGTWMLSSSGNAPVPTVEAARTVLVSGAGTALANGEYTYGGVYNNFPYYVKNGTLQEISRSSSGQNGVWNIWSEVDDLYENNLSGLTSPYNITNPWTRSFTMTFGESPAPTVTANRYI